MPKPEVLKLMQIALEELNSINYIEQFLDDFPDFILQHLPVSDAVLFVLNKEQSLFIPYIKESSDLTLEAIERSSNLILFLKNTQQTIILKDEKPTRTKLLKKNNEQLFQKMQVDLIIPLIYQKKLFSLVLIKAMNKTYKELEIINTFFHFMANMLIPMILYERTDLENSQNYYKIYRMDRLALVGELAASAAHEIKNPLAGISTYLKYFTELESFTKKDIIGEIKTMKASVQRIDQIIRSLLSFSRFKKKKIIQINLIQIIKDTLQSIALKIPSNIKTEVIGNENLIIKSDSQLLQQVLINILLNAIEAICENTGKIVIRTYITGRDRLPSKEMFNISIKDNGPGIPETIKENIFKPFHTTKEDGTGLGLYTCYGLVKSLGGDIKINSDKRGTEVMLALPPSFDEEEED